MLPRMKSNVLQLPTWLNAEEAKAMIPENAWQLLGHRGSLTEYLRNITNNTIQHCLLSANWGHATAMERQALNLNSNDRTWVRRIEWRHNKNLWVHARAIFPEETIKATGSSISGLGVQSLGEVIFKDPNLERSPFTFSLLEKESPLFPLIPALAHSNETIWARRSTLHFQKHPILITEVFLPDAYAEQNA